MFFRSDYGIFGLKEPTLARQFEGLSVEDFCKTCGSEVVTSQKKSAMAYALFTIKNVSESHRREIESTISGGAQAGVWSAQMDASYRSVVRSAIAASSLEVRVHALGGPGIGSLGDLIGPKVSHEDPFSYYSKVPTALERYVRQLNEQNATPTEFQTTPISSFRPNTQIKFSKFKDGQVAMMFSLYEDAASIVKRASNVLIGDESQHYRLTLEQSTYLNNQLASAQKIMNDIYQTSQSCFVESGLCQMPDTKIPAVRWPKRAVLIGSTCDRITTMALDAGCITSDMAEYAKRNNVMPICTSYLRNSESVFDGWKLCSVEQLRDDLR